MAQQRITRRDHQKLFQLPTTEVHEFQLSPFRGHLLEVTDVHFNHDSAVFLPDTDLQAPLTTCTTKYASGLGVLRAALLHAKENPAQKLLIVGHTDTSGAASYNLPLSVKRANAVFHALMGNRDEWVAISNGQHKVEDYQRILQWVCYLWGWPCDPGPVNNVDNAQTRAATKEFQKSYNVEFEAKISEDGGMGPQTWGAMFDVYMAVLKDMLLVDDAGLKGLRNGVHFMDDAKKIVGCGEHHPVDEPRKDNYKSATNRRVEALFFDPSELPDMKCHPTATTCNPDVCELYNVRMYQFQKLPVEALPPYPAMQVTLQYGKIDKLFPPIANNTHTDAGIRARLQAIGFLYEALNGPDIAAIAQAAWDHFRNVFNKPAPADAAAHLKTLVETTILDGNALPAPGAFKKIRLPGTWCITPANENNFFTNSSGGGAHSYRHVEEKRIWDGNASLGLVPIEAKVETRRNGKLSKAGPGVKVHFQLLPPDAVPAAEAAAPLRTTTASSTHTDTDVTPNLSFSFSMTGSPDKYVRDEKARNPGTAGDPQLGNAHKSVGGKAGNAVAGNDHLINVWDVGRQHGDFHSTAPGLKTAAASTRPNAIVVETNADGLADGILMPSWVGGDRYKVRVFLDPVCTNPSDGTEGFAVKAETGTMVVWRIMRISEWLRWDYPAGTNGASTGGPLPPLDFPGVIATELKKAWMDVTVEPAATAPRNLTHAEWQTAMAAAKAATKTRIAAGLVPRLNYDYNIDSLFVATNPTIGAQNVLTRAQYDAAIPSFPAHPSGRPWGTAAGDGNYMSNMGELMTEISMEFLIHFTKNAKSGITVAQAPILTTLGLGPMPEFLSFTLSGIAGRARACWVVFGINVYVGGGFPYDHNGNTLHEAGHVLYGNHQYTRGRQVNSSTGGDFDQHDYHDLCIMGYMQCPADFCGRCTLNHAGWDTRPMPVNSPGP